MKGNDGKWTCETCGASLTGEPQTVQYAYSWGEAGRNMHHLHVGRCHFCNLDCFEEHRRRYWKRVEK